MSIDQKALHKYYYSLIYFDYEEVYMQDLEGFKLYLAGRRGRSATKPSTRAAYLQSLNRLLKESPSLDIEELTQCFNKLLEIGRKPSYINRLLVALQLYGKYLQTDKYKTFQYLDSDPPKKEIMSDEQIQEFLTIPGSPMWQLYFKILAFSGMRPGEVATLTTSSVDLGRNIFEPNGKTGFRPVPIAPALLHDVTEYIKTLDGDYLFPGKFSGTITREAWRLQFNKRIAILGIKRKGLTCHSLRHSFVTRWASEDINIFKIQRMVGHKRIETTEQYMHLVTKDLVLAMNKDPLARQSLAYIERFRLFREGFRKLLEQLAFTPEEEKKMIEMLSL